MRILFSLSSFYPPFNISKQIGGGEISAYELIKFLSRDHQITVISSNDDIKEGVYNFDHCRVLNKPIFWFKGLSKWNQYLRNKIWFRILNKRFRDEKFDLTISQGQFLPSTVKFSKKNNIKSLVFIRAFENFGGKFNFINKKKVLNKIRGVIDKTAQKFNYRENKKAIKSSDVIIANSQYMAGLIDSEFGVNSEVVYPFIDLKKYESITQQNSKDYILFVNPSYHKGVNIFIDIARKMPSQNFLCLGSNAGEYSNYLKKLPNVTTHEWVKDMNKIYSKTQVLLVPSLWPEPFGRVAVEAMCNGIPVIASNNGGLEEIVDGAGILINDVENVDRWCEAINTIKYDGKLYDLYSQKSFERAKIFDKKFQLEKISKFINNL